MKTINPAIVRRTAERLANAYWVRYWYALNYPNVPQGGCIQMREHDGTVVGPDPDSRLYRDMTERGFTWANRYGIVGWHADMDTTEAPHAD